MSPTEVITLTIALAALVTSAVSAYEMVRQNKNAVRPVLVVLEKLADNRNPPLGQALYLVNMGQAVAINVRVRRNTPAILESAERPPTPRSEIAVGRRMVLASGYHSSCLASLELVVSYTDVNNTRYFTQYSAGQHLFGRGMARTRLPGASERAPATLATQADRAIER